MHKNSQEPNAVDPIDEYKCVKKPTIIVTMKGMSMKQIIISYSYSVRFIFQDSNLTTCTLKLLGWASNINGLGQRGIRLR